MDPHLAAHPGTGTYPLAGREDLAVALRHEGGASRFVVIEGAPGSGKSAQLRWAARLAGQTGSLALQARASVLESDFAFGVVRQLFEWQLETATDQDRSAWLRGPAGIVPQVLSLGDDHAGRQDASGHAASHALFWLAANIARHRPLVIMVDDLQWADTASLRWLVHLARRIGTLPVTVVATLGSSESAADAGLIADLVAEVGTMPPWGPGTGAQAGRASGGPEAAPAVQAGPPGVPGSRARFGPDTLTPHEQRLIAMAVSGQTNSEIAERFCVSRRAIEFHFTNIYRKLGITRRPQLYRFAPAEAALMRADRTGRPRSRLLRTAYGRRLPWRSWRCARTHQQAAPTVEHS